MHKIEVVPTTALFAVIEIEGKLVARAGEIRAGDLQCDPAADADRTARPLILSGKHHERHERRPSSPSLFAPMSARTEHLVSNFQRPEPPVVVALCQVASNAIDAILAALIVRPEIGAPLRFDGLRNMVAFVLLAGIAATAVACALAVLVFLATGWPTDFLLAWRQRVLAGLFPTITITPMILLARGGQLVGSQRTSPRAYAELGLLVVGLLAVGIPMLGWEAPAQGNVPGLLLTPLPLLLWAAVRLGPGGLSISLLVVAGVALATGDLGRGPFAVQSSAEDVLSLQIFLIAISIPLMLLVALVEERRRTEDSLKQTEARMAVAVAASDAGLWRCYIPYRYLWRLIVVSLPFCLPATAASPARILIINAWDDTMPAAVLATTAIRNRLAESSLKNAEIYYDTLDLSRFPARVHQERMARLLSEKYAEKPPDILIALGRAAFEYLLRYRETFAPGVPIIVCYWAGATPETIASTSNVTGVFSEFNWSQTFALAARLQPEAREVAIVSGASEPFWEEEAHRQLAPHLGPYKVRYLAGLPYSTLLNEVAHLPRDTIVLILPIFKDGDGVSRIPARVAADVARASSAPTYAPIETFLGTGVVGGYMDTFEASGSASAELAIDVLRRKDATALPAPIVTPHNFVVDARQLQRWGMFQNSLPVGTKLMFKEPTLWEQYRTLVLITVGVIALLVVCLVALCLQVLKRRRAEATLEASEERMRFAAASTDTGLWQYDVSSRHFWATEHCRSMFGLKADSPLATETLLGAVHPDDRATAIKVMRGPAHAGETPGRNEFRVVHPSGQLRWYLATASTEFGKNCEPVRVSGIFRDVTARKKAEQEAEQLEDALRAAQRELARVSRQMAAGAIAASIAHEINQPLSALVTNGGIGLRLLANAESDPDELREVLQRIIDDGHRASHIIASIRAMFRKDHRERSALSVHDLVCDVLALVRGELETQRVSLQADLRRELPPVMADWVQLQQVLLNLVMNAVEAMSSVDKGERSLLVKSELRGLSDVVIMVADSGPGIDPNHLARIFDAFFTTKTHGMGLGLSICQSIVESHGGRLWVCNRIPHGSVFHVQLPGAGLLGE